MSVFINKRILLTNVVVKENILFKKMGVVIFFFFPFWTELSLPWAI